RHPRVQAHRGRDPEADAHGGGAPQARQRPAGRERGRLEGDPPRASGPEGPQARDRPVHRPCATRRRPDPAAPPARRRPCRGRTVDFRHAIVVMTSNVGASDIAKNATIGFTVGDETGVTYDDMKTRIMSELKKVFRPEFLNRIDEVIVFHKLTKDEIKQIVDL